MLRNFTLTIALLSLGEGQIAIASELPSIPQPPGTVSEPSSEAEQPAAAKPEEPQIKLERKRFDSDGTPITHDMYMLSIAPPQGWEVLQNPAGLTYIFQEKEKTKVKPLTKFKRNITVARYDEPRPIDDKSVEEIKALLQETLSKNALVQSEIQFLEHKFFDYAETGDGLVLYSTMMLGEHQMMQMHVVVSGAEDHYLLTYTDMAERFTKDEETFNKAWATMTSVQVEGLAPKRVEQWVKIAYVAGGILALILFLMLIKRMFSTRLNYADEANSVYEDGDWGGRGEDSIARSAIWNLGVSNHAEPSRTPRRSRESRERSYAPPRTREITQRSPQRVNSGLATSVYSDFF